MWYGLKNTVFYCGSHKYFENTGGSLLQKKMTLKCVPEMAGARGNMNRSETTRGDVAENEQGRNGHFKNHPFLFFKYNWKK